MNATNHIPTPTSIQEFAAALEVVLEPLVDEQTGIQIEKEAFGDTVTAFPFLTVVGSSENGDEVLSEDVILWTVRCHETHEELTTPCATRALRFFVQKYLEIYDVSMRD